MKAKGTLILFSSLALAGLVLGFVLFTPHLPESVEILVPRGARNTCSTSDMPGEFTAYLYTNEPECSYFVPANLSGVKIAGEDGLVKLDDPTLSATGEAITQDGDSYQEFLVRGGISIGTDLELDEATLILSYDDLPELALAIGSFTHAVLPVATGDLRTASLCAFVEDGKLAALQVTFSADARIESLVLADLNITASLGEARVIPSLLTPSTRLASLLGEDYCATARAVEGSVSVRQGEIWLIPVKRKGLVTPRGCALWFTHDGGKTLVIGKRIFYQTNEWDYEKTVVSYA